MNWRDKARPIIAAVIAEIGTGDEKALRKALRAAYPFGPREYHPYRIWCDEINVQLGKKPPTGTRAPKVKSVARPVEGQNRLF
jgi:hypothetical protein